MSDYEASLSLDVVKQSFIEAEASLKALATSMHGLDAASAKFDSARQSMAEAAGQMSLYAQRMAGLTEALEEAAAVIRESDPAQLVGKLDGAEKRGNLLQEGIGQVSSQLEAAMRKVSDSGQKLAIILEQGEALSGKLDDSGHRMASIQESGLVQAQRLNRLQVVVVLGLVVGVASLAISIAMMLR